jgi:hypothetical protein
MAGPILFSGLGHESDDPWIASQPGSVMHNARLVRGWKGLAASDGSLVMQGASGECGIDAGESMVVVLSLSVLVDEVGSCKTQTRRDRMVRGSRVGWTSGKAISGWWSRQ